MTPLVAFDTFGKNVAQLMALFRFFDAQIAHYNEHEVPKLVVLCNEAVDKHQPSTPISDLPELGNRLAGHLAVQDLVAWQFGWYAVMLVTIAETYLRDALSEAAAVDPSFMRQSQQPVNYAEILNLTSVDQLKASMRDQWAKNFIESGGPEKWIGKLTRWGARNLGSELCGTLEEIWGIRHVIVHRSGLADDDFCRRHPNVELDRGRVRVVSEDVERYALAIVEFVGQTSLYLRARCNAKVGRV